MSQDSQRQGLDRVPVAEASRRLGLTPDAVRKRLSRGTLHYDRDQDGLIHVYIPSSDTDQDAANTEQEYDQDAGQDSGQELYVRSLEDQIRFLRQELERKDAILLRLAERVPEIEAAASPQQSERPSESVAADSGGIHTPTDESAPYTSSQRPQNTIAGRLVRWVKGRRG